MNWRDITMNYDNVEDFVQENTVHRPKLISPIQARILTAEIPCHMYGTWAYQWTKFGRNWILSCVRDFFDFYWHLLLRGQYTQCNNFCCLLVTRIQFPIVLVGRLFRDLYVLNLIAKHAKVIKFSMDQQKGWKQQVRPKLQNSLT